jgi:hypothetical protein
MELTNLDILRNKVIFRVLLFPEMGGLIAKGALKYVHLLKEEGLKTALDLPDNILLHEFEKALAKEASALAAAAAKPLTSWNYEEWNIRDGLAKRKEPNPDALINADSNFMARGSAMVYNSTTGAGKSSFTAQFMVFMACGLTFFGQKPSRRLKLLLVQNENDVYDAFEAIEGAIFYASKVSGLSIEAITKCVEENCKVSRLHCSGDDLPVFMASKVEELREQGFAVDVVIVDPLLGYFGGLMEPDRTQQWLYTKVTPVVQDSKFILILTHHTTAAQGRAGGRNGGIYSGMGGAVLPGWVRAVANIEPVENDPGLFVLKYEKRAKRLGDKTAWYMKQASDGMVYWESVDAPPNEVEGKKAVKTRLAREDKFELEMVKLREKKEEKQAAESKLYRAIVADLDGVLEIKTETLLEMIQNRFRQNKSLKCGERKAEEHLATMVELHLLKRIRPGYYAKKLLTDSVFC